MAVSSTASNTSATANGAHSTASNHALFSSHAFHVHENPPLYAGYVRDDLKHSETLRDGATRKRTVYTARRATLGPVSGYEAVRSALGDQQVRVERDKAITAVEEQEASSGARSTITIGIPAKDDVVLELVRHEGWGGGSARCHSVEKLV
jgi:hypothetical protein